MYHAIIVDDENLFLSYLKEQVCWKAYRIEILRTFTSSRLALAYLQTEPAVDLVMTDIKMPGLTGIELIEHTPAALKARVCYVVLSGYADFPLVKQAFLAGAKDYILKVDVNTEEFDKTMQKVLGYLAGHARDTADPAASEEAIQARLIDEISAYIKTHLAEPLTLTNLAAHFGFSAGYLSQMFSRRANMTLSDFIANARIEKACQMLLRSDMTITEISYEVGYNSLEHFSRTFRKITDASPRGYRKRNGC